MSRCLYIIHKAIPAVKITLRYSVSLSLLSGFIDSAIYACQTNREDVTAGHAALNGATSRRLFTWEEQQEIHSILSTAFL